MPKFDRHTVLFSLNSFAAAMLALYIAMAIGLPRPYWAMTTAYITSQPLSGAVRSKAVYRLVGTVISGVATVVLVPNLVNAPLVLSFAMALWVSVCLVISLFDRTPRSYMLMLAGYTAALIGFPAVNQPDAVFQVAVARVEEIGLGIICATVVHSLVFPRPVGEALRTRLAEWLADADRWLVDLLQGESAEASARDRRHLAAAASEIRIMAVHLPFDTSRLRDTSAAVQALHERMLLLIPLLSGLADRMNALAAEGGVGPEVEACFGEVVGWVRSGAPDERGRALAAALRDSAAACRGGDWRSLMIESLLVRLSEAVLALSDSHALHAHLCKPDAPVAPETSAAIAGAVSRPLHRDFGLALRSGATCFVAIMVTCALWIWTGWPDGATAAMMTAVFCAFFASMDDPAPAIANFGVYTLAGLPLAAVYLFAILPAIDGFPLLATVLFPTLFVIGLYVADPKTTGKAMPVMLALCSGLALQETFSANFATFLNGNLAQFVGIFIAIFVTRAMRSMDAEAGVRRLLRQTWAAIGRLARRGGAEDPANFAARLVDRLALLTPKLAHQDERGGRVAEDALRDLRVAMNLMSLQQAKGELAEADRARVDRLLDELEAHYARLAGGAAGAPPPALLPSLDAALTALAKEPAGDRRAVLGLVGIRRNLFPAATPFAPQESPA